MFEPDAATTRHRIAGERRDARPRHGDDGPPEMPEATRTVLDAIRLGGARSRGEIAERTGLGRAVVAQRVADLIGFGLVVEEGVSPSTGGRPPRRLSFHERAGSILAADIGATSLDVALTDLAANILAHRGEPADVGRGPEAILGRVEALFDEVLAQVPTDNLLGVGIGVPGPVEFRSGRPVSPPIMPGWDRYPVRERLEARLGAPVWVDNDVNIMAMGEWRRGVAQGHANVIFVKVGTGIGAGLISDGMLHRGAQGAAGDIGHIQVVDRDVICRCGNVGCLEAVAGGQAIARDAEAIARDGGSDVLAARLRSDGTLTAATAAWAAERGDAPSVELIASAGRTIGRVLASLVNFFNPSLIVIGGGVSGAGDALLAAVRGAVYRRSLPLATRDLQIVTSALGETAGVIGAAAMVTDELLTEDRLPATLGRLAAGPPTSVEGAP